MVPAWFWTFSFIEKDTYPRFDSFAVKKTPQTPAEEDLDLAQLHSPQRKQHHVSNKPRGRSSFSPSKSANRSSPASARVNSDFSKPSGSAGTATFTGVTLGTDLSEMHGDGKQEEEEEEEIKLAAFEEEIDQRSSIVLKKLQKRDILAEIGSIIAQGLLSAEDKA